MKFSISRIIIVFALMCVTVTLCWADDAVPPSNPTTAEEMIELGNTYEAEKDYANALLWFNKMISQYPDKALEANFSIGWSYQEQGKYTEAIAAYKSTIASTSSKDNFYSKQARYNLGDCYRDAGEWDAAIAVYTQLAKDYPEDAADKMLNAGGCYKGKGDYDRAMAIYEQVAKDYPEMAGNACLSIDDCFGDQQKNDERLTHLNKMYNEYPDLRAEILFRLGITRGGMNKEYENAIADFKQMIDNYPDFWRIAEAKAAIASITLNEARDTTKARALLEQFIAEYHNYGDMMFVKINLADSVYQEGKYLEAIKLYEDTLQYEDPQGNYHAMVLSLIADCYQRVGNLVKAKETVDKLLKLYPSDPAAVPAVISYEQNAWK